MIKRLLFFFSLILLISGCSIYHVNSEDTATDYYPPKKSADEVAYLENVDRPHEVIAYITVNTERNQRMNDVVEKMKQEAAILGADAITDIKTDATGVFKKLPAQHFFGNGYVRANFKVAAIVFK